ncbi:ATP-binding protein [Halopelagius longus]|uniref:histidine kinase n=1 Tax=Halopelagius longus TaxID=1236180 RepID=A0A1H1FCW5_9EURY|nr:ATP-binding protein [Halopelagius longus]RDI70167.1 GHKL domain-containing protein [Halopelagius longus]SDQ98624.1 Signal transduction histidine kinase [Halopelagius longus]
MDLASRLSAAFPPDKIPLLISRVGVLFFLAFVVEWIAFYGLHVEPLLTANFLLTLLFTVVFSVGIVYGGHHIESKDLSPKRYPRIAKWFVGGITLFFGVNAPMMVVWYPGTLHGVVGWARISMAMGGVGGLVFGIIEARAIERELSAERAAIRADEAESQRQWFDYLNSLLRHEVLNTANVITGYASVHMDDDDLDDELRRNLERIHRQGRDMAEVIRDVQVLMQASQGNIEREAVDLSEVLATTLDDPRGDTEAVEVTTSIPDGVYVMADDLLPRVFANLFANAVQHNDSETPRVDVTVEVGADAATVSIADNGPGISDSVRETLFERSDNTGGSHGIGLYLVRTLVERYGGTVQLSETGPDGSVFTVELPLADEATRSGQFSNGTSLGAA